MPKSASVLMGSKGSLVRAVPRTNVELMKIVSPIRNVRLMEFAPIHAWNKVSLLFHHLYHHHYSYYYYYSVTDLTDFIYNKNTILHEFNTEVHRRKKI